MTYRVEIKASAQKELAAIQKQDRERIHARILLLADDPRPSGVKKMVGSTSEWRLRVGNYRIVYAILDQRLLIEVIKIGDRKEVYR